MSDFKNKIGSKIIEATKEIFSTMVMTDVEEMLTNGDSCDKFKSSLSSMLGMGGDIRGLLTIHFSANAALFITSSFLGMDVDDIDEDVKDAVGEIANMVAGSLKVFLVENKIQTELAIPTTVIGKSYRVSGLLGAEKIEVPFQCNSGNFIVELKYLLNSEENLK